MAAQVGPQDRTLPRDGRLRRQLVVDRPREVQECSKPLDRGLDAFGVVRAAQHVSRAILAFEQHRHTPRRVDRVLQLCAQRVGVRQGWRLERACL